MLRAVSSDEVRILCDFLDEQLPRVKANISKFIAVDDDKIADSLASLQTILSRSSVRESLDLLTDYNLLPEDIVRAVIHRDRETELAEFANMLEQSLVEADWQHWFERNDWVLGTDFVRILPDRRIDVANVSDYLVESLDHHLDVVEIKRPSTQFWSGQRDHGNLIPHQELTKAIVQSLNYVYELEREMNSAKTQARLGGTPIAKPRVLLILGRSATWSTDEFQAQRLLNAGLTGIQVLTFDEVLDKAKRSISAKSRQSPSLG